MEIPSHDGHAGTLRCHRPAEQRHFYTYIGLELFAKAANIQLGQENAVSVFRIRE